MRILCDTNVLVEGIDFKSFEKVLIPVVCLEELDGLKVNRDPLRAMSAKRAIRDIKENIDKNVEFIYGSPISNNVLPIDYDIKKVDNKLLEIAITHKEEYDLFYSLDFAVIVKAKKLGIKMYEPSCEYSSYKGCRHIFFTDEEMANHYTEKENYLNLKNNEYLIVHRKEDGSIVDKQKWTPSGLKKIKYNTIKNAVIGIVEPRNLEQELYMDLLMDQSIKVKCVQGGYGTGKDFLALSVFVSMINKTRPDFQKIVWIRNNIETDGSNPIGYLPGNTEEKLMPYVEILGDFMGDGKDSVFSMLQNGQLEILHTGTLRGRDLRNSIIYCTEAQNMSANMIALILSRVSEGSIAFFNGDIKQIDNKTFCRNNGLEKLIEKLGGNSLFGYVELEKCERSEVAKMAALLE